MLICLFDPVDKAFLLSEENKINNCDKKNALLSLFGSGVETGLLVGLLYDVRALCD